MPKSTETETKYRLSFHSDTLHRMMVEAVRFWAIEHFLRIGELPEREVRFVYAKGPHSIDWGDAPGPDDGNKPFRGKRVIVTFEVEDWP